MTSTQYELNLHFAACGISQGSLFSSAYCFLVGKKLAIHSSWSFDVVQQRGPNGNKPDEDVRLYHEP